MLVERSVESGPATTQVGLCGWDDQQIFCMEGPNLLLPFFRQDSFFNVLDSFHFTIQNYVVSNYFGNNGANESFPQEHPTTIFGKKSVRKTI